jgi:Spy/CpxP family protein refolding chaperone
MKTFRMLMLTACLTVFGAPAFAQQGPPPGQMGGQFDDDMDIEGAPGRGGPPSEERREEIRKKVEVVRMMRLTEELQLDSQTGMKLAALLGSLDKKRWDLMRESREFMMELQSALKAGKPDERKLKAVLDKLERNHREMTELRERELRVVKEILSVEQQARYLVFQQNFLREMQGRIAGARGGMGPGMRGGPGQGRGGTGPGPGPGGYPQ